ncbi:MAG: SURF1 family protein [Proteobacteria bacterium]|nr:MAG: SURF1 family protein [Pseudomonadota bacterium]
MQSGEFKQPKKLLEWHDIKDYQTVQITGHYHNTHFLLANQFHDGQVGFNVLTAFLTEHNIWLLVNRGWIASPNIDVTVDEKNIQLSGMLAAWPRPGVQLGEQVLQNISQQQVTYLPIEQTKVFMTQHLCQRDNCSILNRVVKLDGDAQAGFVRDWQAPMMTAARHRAYAFQWFIMSLALCLIYLYFIRRSYAIKK